MPEEIWADNLSCTDFKMSGLTRICCILIQGALYTMRTRILSGAQVRDKIIWAIGMLMLRFFRIASVLFRAKVLREILALFCASSTNSRLIYLGLIPRSLRCLAHCHCMRVMLTCCCVVPLLLVWLTSEKIHCGAR